MQAMPAAPAPTEAEQQAVMAAWGAWFGELGAAVVDGGAPTYPVSTVAADGSVHPGGGANPLSGYSIIEAADAEAAVGLAAGCPVLAAGGIGSGTRCSGGGKLSGSRAQPVHHAIESSARERDRVTNPDCNARKAGPRNDEGGRA